MGAYILIDDGSAIHFDMVRTETVTLGASVTEHPVEQGADIADHIRPELVKVRLEVFVSNAPVEDVNGFGQTVQTFTAKVNHNATANDPLAIAKSGNVIGAIGSAINAGAAAIGSALGLDDGLPKDFQVQGYAFAGNVPDGFDFVKNMAALLENIKDTPTLVTVVTHARYCANLAITNIDCQKHNDGGYITIDFKELRFVSTSTVDAPTPVKPASKPKKPAGVQELSAAPQQSIAAGLVDMAGLTSSLPPAAP